MGMSSRPLLPTCLWFRFWGAYRVQGACWGCWLRAMGWECGRRVVERNPLRAFWAAGGWAPGELKGPGWGEVKTPIVVPVTPAPSGRRTIQYRIILMITITLLTFTFGCLF